MQPPGCSGPGGFYGPTSLAYMQPQGPFNAAPQAARQEQSEPSVQTCVRDSVRLLGEAVAVLEGIRLLGSQLLQWGGELSQVVQSVIPAALILQVGSWMYTRTIGASRRHTLNRMHKAWREASSVGMPNNKLVPPNSGSGSRWLSTLRDLSAVLALIIVASELYIHLNVYRRLLSRLRTLTAKDRVISDDSPRSCNSSNNGCNARMD